MFTHVFIYPIKLSLIYYKMSFLDRINEHLTVAVHGLGWRALLITLSLSGIASAQTLSQINQDLAAQAHECVAIDNAGSGNFGAFKNMCGYRVNFYSCNFRPRTTPGGFNWSADFDCEKQKFGLHTPNGGSTVAAHNRNTEKVYWFACRAPATPAAATFVAGKGIEARCQ